MLHLLYQFLAFHCTNQILKRICRSKVIHIQITTTIYHKWPRIVTYWSSSTVLWSSGYGSGRAEWTLIMTRVRFSLMVGMRHHFWLFDKWIEWVLFWHHLQHLNSLSPYSETCYINVSESFPWEHSYVK